MADSFENTLKSRGINSATLDILKNEDVVNMKTLQNLNEKDISELKLTIGQRSIIRQLTLDQKDKSKRLETESTTDVNSGGASGPQHVTASPDCSPELVRRANIPTTPATPLAKNTDSTHPRDSDAVQMRRVNSQRTETKQKAPLIRSSTLPAPHQTSEIDFRIPNLEAELDDLSKSIPSTKGESPERHLHYEETATEYVTSQQLRRDKTDVLRRTTVEEDASISMRYMCLEMEKKVKVIVELNTSTDVRPAGVATRIMLLVDTSGSMLLKSGKSSKQSKISLLKQFARALVDVLDDGDQAGLVTFGQTAEVLLPLQTVSTDKRKNLKDILEGLTRRNMSHKTNLSAGLTVALAEFGRVSRSRTDELAKYKNCIIVFSDGEVNEGTTKPQLLVHETRDRIRQMAPTLGETENQWVSISVVTTGDSVSESTYLLSKTCSSDSYLFIDGDVVHVDADLFLPVLLRKSAVVWNVSVEAEALNGADWISEECTQHNRLRLSPRSDTKSTKAFFYYDIPVSASRHIGLVLDMDGVRDDGDDVILRLVLRYTDCSGERCVIVENVSKSQMFPNDPRIKDETVQAVCMQDTRDVVQVALHNAAENVKSGNPRKSVFDLESGKSEIQTLCHSYGEMACVEESRVSMAKYAHSIVDSMQDLITAIKSSTGDGNDVWGRIKAVSSAITREVPTTSNIIANTSLLCPLPPASFLPGRIQEHVKSLYEEQGVRQSTLLNYGHVTQELRKSLK